MIAEIYIRAWQSAFAGLVPRHYLDGMDLAAETAGWDDMLRASRWPKAGALVAEEEAGVTGFAGFGPSRESPATAELSTLYALPIAWGTGVGRHLMAATASTLQEAGYRSVKLWVLEANTRARRFYDAAGWLPDGTVTLDSTGGVPLPKMRYALSLKPGSLDQ